MMAIEKDRLATRYVVRNDEFDVKKSADTDEQESVDVVDYAFTKVALNPDQQLHKPCPLRAHTNQVDETVCKRTNPLSVPQQRNAQSPQYSLPPSAAGEKTSTLATQLWTASIDRKIGRFQFTRKKSEPICAVKERPKFVRCSSIARLFGNTYSTQQSLQLIQQQQQQQQKQQNKDDSKSTTTSTTTIPTTANALIKCRPTKCERFKKRTENQIENPMAAGHQRNVTGCDGKELCAPEDKDLSGRALRSLSKSLGRLWRRSHSIEISPPDPEYKVLYLGNVLTGWAKGDSCVEKPLSTLWRNYTTNHKPDVVMRIQVCPSGLKATTRQHGLTEYWSNRITHCSSPKNYPRIFCWIYRHEGRKLKHELRCHAVLCPKETIAEQICKTLKENISRALQEFKRDKINRQNARLSLVNSVYDNPSMPRRKILLSVGANNYRPPMERSKSAPKLMAIEEAVGEEEEETIESVCAKRDEESRPACCKVGDPLFPAMTLGRKHCRRGHSIRRTKNNSERMRSVSFDDNITIKKDECGFGTYQKRTDGEFDVVTVTPTVDTERPPKVECSEKRCVSGRDDDEDEFNSLLMINDYDSHSSLSGELMSYFDTTLKLKSAVSLSDLSARPNGEQVSMTSELFGNRIALSLDNLDQYSDESSEHDSDKYRRQHYYDDDGDDDDDVEGDDDDSERSNTFYDQHEIIDCLVTVSQKVKIIDEQTRHATATTAIKQQTPVDGAIGVDSDEGSISSGCETSSTVTTTHYDDILRGDNNSPPNSVSHSCAINRQDLRLAVDTKTMRNGATMQQKCIGGNEEDCNSEMSDESGFDEYQNFAGKTTNSLMRHEVNGNSVKNNNKKHMLVDIIDSTNSSSRHSQINDSNNNTNCRPPFNGVETNNNNVTTNKDPGRLMINIPKNAKSILI